MGECCLTTELKLLFLPQNTFKWSGKKSLVRYLNQCPWNIASALFTGSPVMSLYAFVFTFSCVLCQGLAAYPRDLWFIAVSACIEPLPPPPRSPFVFHFLKEERYFIVWNTTFIICIKQRNWDNFDLIHLSFIVHTLLCHWNLQWSVGLFSLRKASCNRVVLPSPNVTPNVSERNTMVLFTKQWKHDVCRTLKVSLQDMYFKCSKVLLKMCTEC